MAEIEEERDSKHLFKHLSPPTSLTIFHFEENCFLCQNVKYENENV